MSVSKSSLLSRLVFIDTRSLSDAGPLPPPPYRGEIDALPNRKHTFKLFQSLSWKINNVNMNIAARRHDYFTATCTANWSEALAAADDGRRQGLNYHSFFWLLLYFCSRRLLEDIHLKSINRWRHESTWHSTESRTVGAYCAQGGWKYSTHLNFVYVALLPAAVKKINEITINTNITN